MVVNEAIGALLVSINFFYEFFLESVPLNEFE